MPTTPTPTPKPGTGGKSLLPEIRKMLSQQPHAVPTDQTKFAGGRSLLSDIKANLQGNSEQKTPGEIARPLPFMAIGLSDKGEPYYGPGAGGSLKKIFAGIFNPELYNESLRNIEGFDQNKIHTAVRKQAETWMQKLI